MEHEPANAMDRGDLPTVGAQLRAARRAAALTQADVAKRAGITRQKLIQLEHGKQGAAQGAYEAAAAALGFRLALVPAMVRLGDYPQLRRITWNRQPEECVPEAEALALYERNWALVDEDRMPPAEKALLRHLVSIHGNGVLHV